MTALQHLDLLSTNAVKRSPWSGFNRASKFMCQNTFTPKEMAGHPQLVRTKEVEVNIPSVATGKEVSAAKSDLGIRAILPPACGMG